MTLDRWMRAMRSGDFEAAWRVTDSLEQPRRTGQCPPQAENLLWDGSPMEDRNVLVRCRHGLGDSIQFLRYLPLIRAKSIAAEVQPELRGLFPYHPAPFDLEIECMELPYAFRTTLDTIPAAVPYLRAQADPSLAIGTGFNVGLVWGSGGWDPSRSMTLHHLAPLANLRGIEWYSLQQGPALDELRLASFCIRPLHDKTASATAAASAMLDLDLILTVDTMTAHLAGALGRRVWTLLPYEADWRWMNTRTDSPWYPTMRLFRQPAPGDWDSVVHDVITALQGLPGQR